jgi:thymidine phosphorylase
VGNLVKKGEALAIVLANDREKGEEAVKNVLNVFQIGPRKRKNLKKILYYLDSKTLRKWSY